MAREDIFSKLEYDEKGRLVFGSTPMILTTRDFVACLMKTMEDRLGEMGAEMILYDIGFKAAYKFAVAQAKDFKVKSFDILKKYLEGLTARGWASKTEFKILSENPIKIVVRMYNTIAEEWGNVGKTVCHLWEGGLAGILTCVVENMGRKTKITSMETKCIAKGDPYCEIIVWEKPNMS